jgi:cytochrome c6
VKWQLFLCSFLLAACTADAPRGDPVSGAELAEDVRPSCGLCHTLAGADFVGRSAPDLDHLRPGYQRVYDAIREGPGMMPSYRGILTERQMHDLAAFISREAGT